ncbi:MAG: hypothetical protein IBX64_09340 [Actinobacteria bacterium]|nr:hypothetical protein [Actinomycetota bacterium]
MMGHHGMGFLFRLVEEVLEQNRENRERKPRALTEKEQLDEELKIMYASGDIDEDGFDRMRIGIRTGKVTWQDLEQLKKEAAERKLAEIPEERDLKRARADIEKQRGALLRAKEESLVLVTDLSNRLSGLKTEANELESKAREVLKTDEVTARSYLEQKQDVEDRMAKIEQQLTALQRDIERVEELNTVLDEKEEELKILEARGRLAALRTRIQKPKEAG